ncbi:MAG: glycosyltransferase family 2 protein, partial [Alteromonadaceae bacterium]|nr:glycosyltransferase family 2 protein [Alteromonadaceae bacterium]
LLLARVLSNQRFTSRDIDNSARIFESVSIIFGTDKFGERDRLIFAEVLQDRGNFDAALDLLKDGNMDSSDPIQFGLVSANRARIIDSSQKSWLRYINSIYKKGDLSTLYLSPESTGTPLDRLSSGTKSGVIDGPLVSVLIPTFNGASRIHTALASLKAQTWSQIEIIVIDDGSTESNNEKLRSVCASFSDVTLLEQGKNLGAYEARNRGLRIAKGDFITVHDDDDWSHPQKIAMQVQHLLDHPQFAANTTKHVRVTEDLEFTRINSNPTYVQDNLSSLMFRKSIVQKIGSWDVANRGADEEFKNRIVKIGGFEIAAVGKCPMSFTRTHTSSLTSGELFRGFQDPARLIYHAGYKLGHKDFLSGSSAGLADFVRPLNMQPGNRGKEFGKFDAVFAGDFTSLTPQLVRAIYEAEILAKSGKRIAFLYLHSPFVYETPNVTDELLQSAKNIGFEFLTLVDRAIVEALIVIDPAVLVFAENLKTNLEVTESAIRLESPFDRSQLAPTIALDRSVENLENIFGVEPIVFFTEEGGLNEQLRLIYHTVKFSDSNWKSFRSLPLTQPKTYEPDRLPIIGRHSRNTNTPWPENLEEIRLAYVQPDLSRTRIYEDISHLSQTAQELLTSGAEIVSAEHVPLTDYLDSLDFWVVQFSGRKLRTIPSGVYDALCRGLVVILPPQFEPIFGDAALYSEPKQIPNLVKRVWGTRILYGEQSKRATKFAQGLSSTDMTRPLTSAR